MSRVGGNLIVFDIETGGFKGDTNPLVEISLIGYDPVSYKEIGRYEAIVQPYYENPITKGELVYTDGAMKTHGISIAQMESEGKDLQLVLKESLQFIKDCKISGRNGKPYLAGHNIINFDIPFLNHPMSWFKIDWLKESQDLFIDTLPFARLIWPTTKTEDPSSPVKDHQLGTICEALGVKLTNAHRASSDVEANAEAILNLIKMMRGGIVSTSNSTGPSNGALPFKI